MYTRETADCRWPREEIGHRRSSWCRGDGGSFVHVGLFVFMGGIRSMSSAVFVVTGWVMLKGTCRFWHPRNTESRGGVRKQRDPLGNERSCDP